MNRLLPLLLGPLFLPAAHAQEDPAVYQMGESGCTALQAWEELERVAAHLDGMATPARSDTLSVCALNP